MPKTRAARDRKVVVRTAVAREMRVLLAFAFGIELAPPLIPHDEALLDLVAHPYSPPWRR